MSPRRIWQGEREFRRVATEEEDIDGGM